MKYVRTGPINCTCFSRKSISSGFRSQWEKFAWNSANKDVNICNILRLIRQFVYRGNTCLDNKKRLVDEENTSMLNILRIE